MDEHRTRRKLANRCSKQLVSLYIYRVYGTGETHIIPLNLLQIGFPDPLYITRFPSACITSLVLELPSVLVRQSGRRSALYITRFPSGCIARYAPGFPEPLPVDERIRKALNVS